MVRKSCGERSLLYARGLSEAGHLRLNVGDYPGAEAYQRQALALGRQFHAREPVIADRLQSLGYTLVMQGKCDEAEQALAEAQGITRRIEGEKSFTLYYIQGLFGLSHFLRGDYATAEREMREVTEAWRPIVDPGNEEWVGGTVVRALCLTRLGRAAEGEPLLRESLESSKANHLIGMVTPANVAADLGECLLAQGRYAEAEPLLKDSHAELEKTLGDKHPTTAEVRRHLHELYTARGQPDEAAHYR